jgi:hypothetical protein
MSFKNENALKRIFNTFKRLNKNIFQQDIDALKQLKESLDFYKIQQVNDNKIYAKVLCMLIKERYMRYGDINFALKSISKDLKGTTLEEQLEMLTSKIRTTEIYTYLQQCKIDVPNNELNDYEALCKREEEWGNKYDKQLFDKIIETWNTDFITDRFYTSANEILQDVDNYK